MTNEALEAIPALAILAEAVALLWALTCKDVKGVVLVNALGAAGLMFLIVPKLAGSVGFADVISMLQLGLLAFALATLVTSVTWFANPVGQAWAAWTEFSVLAGLSMAILIFVLTFKITHLG